VLLFLLHSSMHVFVHVVLFSSGRAEALLIAVYASSLLEPELRVSLESQEALRVPTEAKVAEEEGDDVPADEAHTAS